MPDSVADDGWVRVAPASRILEDSAVAVQAGDRPVCLVRTRQRLYAVLDECSHGAVPLSDGEVAAGTIECWLHGSRFDLATGRPLTPPATRPVPTFPGPRRRRRRLRLRQRRRTRGVGPVTQPDDGGAIDLSALADELLAEAAAQHSQRAARTLPHPVDGLRHTVIALSEGAQLHEHNSPPGPAVLLVLLGHAHLVAGDQSTSLHALQHAPIPPRRHSLHADSDTVVLLTVAAASAYTHPSPPATSETG